MGRAAEGLVLLTLVACTTAPCAPNSGPTGPSPDDFWEVTREVQGTMHLAADRPEATVTLRATSSYLVDAFRFERTDMTVVASEFSTSARDPRCQQDSNRGYPTGFYYCPPSDPPDCVASSDYPQPSGHHSAQDGASLVFLCVPKGTARPELQVAATLVEKAAPISSTPLDRGLLQYVNWLYGWSMVAAATQPVGQYVATFQVHVSSASPLKADQTVPWRARVNIRGMNGMRSTVPPDARLEFIEVP